MPYRRTGSTIYKKSGGKWRVKAHAKSVAAAKKMINLLNAVDHGWKPRKK